MGELGLGKCSLAVIEGHFKGFVRPKAVDISHRHFRLAVETCLSGHEQPNPPAGPGGSQTIMTMLQADFPKTSANGTFHRDSGGFARGSNI